MASFSFDIVSEIDKAEMNNVFMQAEKEIQGRYDFKGTSAGIDWLDDKKGLKLTGDNDWQVDAVLDIVRKKLAARGQSSKVLDFTKEKVTSNLKTTWKFPSSKASISRLPSASLPIFVPQRPRPSRKSKVTSFASPLPQKMSCRKSLAWCVKMIMIHRSSV